MFLAQSHADWLSARVVGHNDDGTYRVLYYEFDRFVPELHATLIVEDRSRVNNHMIVQFVCRYPESRLTDILGFPSASAS